MYLKKIKLKNLGPIDELSIEARFTNNGSPIPIALVGQNGAGKSLTLSIVLDAVTEARRACFSELKEVGASEYLRVSSKNYIRRSGGYSHAQAIISNGESDIEFNEIVSNITYQKFETIASDLLNLPNLQNSEFQTSGFHKHINIQDSQKKYVKEWTFLYFPYFRYESAYWMNEKANIDFVKSSNFYGQSKLNPIRANIIEETKLWILNVLLDRELYEKQIKPVSIIQGIPPVTAFLGYSGPNTKLFEMVNEILTAMLKAKDSTVEFARVGISRKGNRTISVFVKRQEQNEEVVAPDLSQLSSGELMTLGLATEIIRSYELIKGVPPENLFEVTGLVLIDEIDLHLHISFQKSVLPMIIRKFPNVQFLLTTHSPFFLLGMAECGEIDVYSLPIGNRIAPEEFTEFQASYDIFFQKNDQFRWQYEALRTKFQEDGRPLIITEGKTDWKHIKNALTIFKQQGQYIDIDVDFFEFENEINMGDAKLGQMCEYLSTLPSRRKMIFIFDRDNPQITKQMSGEPNEFKLWGNSVFSICLPVPSHRVGYKNLSIELYYTDDTLRTVDVSGKRLWFTNEIEIITRPASGQKIYRALDVPNISEELDKKVFDQPTDQIMNSQGQYVGLSKSAFTEVIILNNDISNSFNLDAFGLLFNVLRKVFL